MQGFSEVSLSGNLTKDPMIGQNYAKFTVAVEQSYKNQQGFQKMTNFIPIVVFGNLIESAKRLSKGDYVVVRGEIRSKVTDDKHLLVNVNAYKILKISISNNSGNNGNGYNNQQYNNSYGSNQAQYKPAQANNVQHNVNSRYPQQQRQVPQQKQPESINYNREDDFSDFDDSDTIPF